MQENVCTLSEYFCMILTKTKEQYPDDFKDIICEMPIINKQLLDVEFKVLFTIQRQGNATICEFNISGNIGQGIYEIIPFGLIKINSTDNISFKRLSAIATDFVLTADNILYDNLDLFIRTGIKIDVYDNENKVVGFFCKSENEIKGQCRVMIDGKSYTRAVVTDNLTKETKEIKIELFTEKL